MTRDDGTKAKKKYEAGRRTEKEVRGRAKCKRREKELRGRAKNQEFGWKKGGKAVRGRAKKQRFFEKKIKRKKILSEANGRHNNDFVLAGRRFLTRKLATCSRYTVKTNTKRTRHALGSSTIIFIKKQQYSTTITMYFRRRTHSVT